MRSVSVAEKVGVSPMRGLLFASFKVIKIVEAASPSAMTGPVPEIVELATAALSEVKITFPSILETGLTNVSVFISAFVEASKQVESPLVSVEEQAP